MKEEQQRIGKFNCRVFSSNGKGPAIVLLHGYMFTAEIWKEIGLLSGLEEKNIPFTALDMPYGHHTECDPKSSDPADSINVLKEAAGAGDIIIGASVGGHIALKYAVDHPVGGLILIAPVRTLQEDLVQRYDALNVPVLLIYGEKDTVVAQHEMEQLSTRLNATLHIYADAGHPAYRDLPEKFIKDALSFYEGAV